MNKIHVILLMMLLFSCADKEKEEIFNLEKYLVDLSSKNELPGFILQDYKMDSIQIKKDTSNNGKFITYSLKKENFEIYSHAILHQIDSAKLRFITIVNQELYKNDTYEIFCTGFSN